ncbi:MULTISPECIES: serine hydrolase domain-containing protein [unclassified Crossiella]|uniref:serine hydrolase domain-containing protein n=1 Tax=unclassified Crossiella TaxID=2620835 RepID=UPI001FFEB5A5|nr:MULTISPECIES: serine hydrolase domain-containing protein [unclassified Crossiella]MCK2241476.1 beta-lactamase family protein [Crossiella sp. S99.2]MCK2255652.1 beta-lactamase family protein [Crossiella sp. S99.1]
MHEINGTVRTGFEGVRDAFTRNFTEGREAGAGLVVLHHGNPLVDLWGGLADPATGRRWQRDTLATVASTTKAMAAVAALTLVDRGLVELDEPIARYWPEFAAAGKAGVTLRMLLSHSSGLVTLDADPITYPDLVAITPTFDKIAAAGLEWAPGSAHGYHGVTLGHALSGLVHRVTERSVGTYFAAEIAGPLGLDCFIGLPEAELPRLARLVLPGMAEEVRLGETELREWAEAAVDPLSLGYRATQGSLAIGWAEATDPKFALVEAPSTDGVASAAGLAGLFASLLNGRAVSRELVDQARRRHASGVDRVLGCRTDWGLGFMLPGGPMVPDALPEGAFGHGGSTGAFGFADPGTGLSFGYVPNRGAELLEGVGFRVTGLVEAVYAAVRGGGLG